MHFEGIESHTEVAVLIDELERLATEVEERKSKETKELVLRGEVVFIRPAKVRALIYEKFKLYNHFEARKFVKEFATNTRKLDYYVDMITIKVCEFFKQYGYYRKPIPKEFLERVIDYYFKATKASRIVYVTTKTISKKKREIRAPTLRATEDESEEPPKRPTPRPTVSLVIQFVIGLGIGLGIAFANGALEPQGRDPRPSNGLGREGLGMKGRVSGPRPSPR
jgi:hypothetical protein